MKIYSLLLASVLFHTIASAQTSPEVIAARAAVVAANTLVQSAASPAHLLIYIPNSTDRIPHKWRVRVVTYSGENGIDVNSHMLSLHTSGTESDAMNNAALMGYSPTHGVDFTTGKIFIPAPVNVAKIPDSMIEYLHEAIHQNGPVTYPVPEPFGELEPIVESDVGEQMEAPAPTVAPQ